jgi:hypothetical protein
LAGNTLLHIGIAMKSKIVSFILLYILVPLVIIPLLSAGSGNWFGLFGMLFYYLGVLIARSGLWIFFPIPLFFCFWYWYTYGFGIRDYPTVFLFCIISGMAMYQIKKEYDRYFNKTLPEMEQNDEYNEKMIEMERRLEMYRHEHPGEKISLEIMENIKNEVFFRQAP